MTEGEIMQLQELSTICKPTFCPGCGDMAIWAAFKNAAVKEGWDNTNTVLTAGIGCHGHILNFTKIVSFEGLHGRPIPVATGCKLANNSLNVFAFSGDGDCLGEGGNHFIHACRRNHDITVLLHDNAIYGLTTGQTSPTSPHGYKSKSTPQGNVDNPLNPVALAIASGATFVARGYAGNIPHLTDLMIKANKHHGFSVIDILQPCITWNKNYTPLYYQQNVYVLDEKYDPKNKETAFAKSLEWGEKHIPLGVIYESDAPSYESQLPQIEKETLVEKPVDRKDLSDLFKKYT
jgi:2-oxoglutarate ferredoxin oxidoreductase subunit beta